MTDDVANHTLELFRTIRSDVKTGFGDLRRDIQDLSEQVRIANAHIVGLVRHENLTDSRIAEMQLRIERLERALVLTLPDHNIPEK